MELLKQNAQEPNCFACAAVMVLRHTVEIHRPWFNPNLEHLLEYIGHRGQEELWPGEAKGVHPQEVIDWYIHFGYTLWLLERFPQSAPKGLEDDARMVWDGEQADARFWSILKKNAGILIMPTHAIAWDGKQGYDPNGFILKDLENLIIEAWLIVSL